MLDWRTLLATSRPGTWVLFALPFVVAALDARRGLDPAIVLGAIYLTLPYGLLAHGLERIHGSGSESGSGSAVLTAVERRPLELAIAAANLPILAVFVLLAGAGAGAAIAIAIAAAVVHAVPPVRTRDRPVLDVVVPAVAVTAAAAAGSFAGGLGLDRLPWLPLVALLAWAVATGILRTVAAAGTDREAGRTTTATVFGSVPAAAFTMAGYVIAAGVTASLGPLGALAGLGLDLFLLPAVTVLLARGDPGREARAGERAWADVRGLAWLVAAWLAILLLRHWALLPGSTWSLTIGATVVLLVVALANVVATRVATRRRRPRHSPEPDVVPVTVVVTCRDAADRLPACLDALLAQTYADTSIVVVDDGSTDGSAGVARERLGRSGRVVTASEPPEGWGRSRADWARQVGAEAATGDLLLFIDVDTVLVPVAVRLIVEQAQLRGFALVSGVARAAMPTAGERAAMPGYAMALFGFVPVWWSAWTHGRPARLAFAYGSPLLVRREAYQAVSGAAAVTTAHATAADRSRWDLVLAHAVAASGGSVGTIHAADLAASRHHRDADAAVGGWRRGYLAAVGGSLATAIGAIALQGLALLVPLLLPLLAILSRQEPRLVVATTIPLLLLIAMRLVLALTQRHPLRTIAWHPVTVGLTLIGQLAGIVDHVALRSTDDLG